MSSVIRLILPGGLGGELLAAPWALQATPLQPPWALRVSAIGLATAKAAPLQNCRKAQPAETKVVRAMNGQLLAIGSRNTTVAAATRTSVAQIEFVASQKRPEVTKLDEKEPDKPLKIRLCPASDAKLLIYRLTVVATFIAVFVLSERIRFSLHTITKSSVVSEASRFARSSVSEPSRLPGLKKQSGTLRLPRFFREGKAGRFAYIARPKCSLIPGDFRV